VRNLNKYQALLLFAIVPYLVRLVIQYVGVLNPLRFVGILLSYGLIALWFYSVWRFVKRFTKFKVYQRNIITLFLLLTPTFPIVAELLSGTANGRAWTALGLLFYLTIAFSAIFFLSRSFRTTVERSGVFLDSFLIFVWFLIYPVALWLYQDLMNQLVSEKKEL
jgi:hypothetical protein